MLGFGRSSQGAAEESAPAGESKRQQKLRQRAEKGDPRVKQGKRYDLSLSPLRSKADASKVISRMPSDSSRDCKYDFESLMYHMENPLRRTSDLQISRALDRLQAMHVFHNSMAIILRIGLFVQ